MTALVCPACHGWRRHPGDRVCGNCGESFIRLSAVVKPQYRYAAAGGAAVPVPAITVALKNEGPIGAADSAVVLRDPETGGGVAAETIRTGILEHQGDQWSFDISGTALGGAAGRWRGVLAHSPPGGGPERVLAALQYGLPEPVLALAAADLAIRPGAAESERIALSLTLAEGELAPVRDIAVLPAEGGDGAVAPAVLRPVEGWPPVEPGRPVAVPLALTEPLADRLRLHHGGVGFLLQVALADHDRPKALPFRLRYLTPARPKIAVPERIKALSGRRARLTVTLRNDGGTASRLDTTTVQIDGGTLEVPPFALPHRDADPTLGPGAVRVIRMAVPLADAEGRPLPPRTYFCDVRQSFLEPELEPVKVPLVLDLRPAQPFQGFMSIDFGTTVSAVAYIPDSGAHEPQVLPLGEADSYIPMAIAYHRDPATGALDWCIGNAARRRAEQAGNGGALYFDNLKWRIDIDGQEMMVLPDGPEVSWIDIAADYLRTLKAEVEEHPAIAALLEKVYPTCPARFGGPATAGLLAAFERAGMRPMRVPDAAGFMSVISESWSPLILALPLPELEKVQTEATGITTLFSERLAGRHTVLTYDVGGGSTDMSLFVVEIVDRSKMTVREIATDGDNDFAGNGIAALLYEHLRPSLETWMQRRRIDPQEVPVHLPWQPVPPRGVDAVASRNGRAVARLLLALQLDDGPFKLVVNTYREKHGRERMFQFDKKGEELWKSSGAQNKLDEVFGAERLTLHRAAGGTLEIPWEADGLRLDLTAFLRAYAVRFAAPMGQRLVQLVNRLGTDAARQIHILITGRGSLFPLVSPMLMEHLTAVVKPEQRREVRVDSGHRKTITSLGACFLAEMTLSSADIGFVSEARPMLGVVGDKDPKTGHQRFLPLAKGYPTPKDGIVAVPRPLRPGNLERIVELVLAADRTAPIPPDHPRLLRVQREVDLTAEQAAGAHVLVQAVCDHCLKISIGCAPQSGKTPADWRGLKVVELATYPLFPGACDGIAGGKP